MYIIFLVFSQTEAQLKFRIPVIQICVAIYTWIRIIQWFTLRIYTPFHSKNNKGPWYNYIHLRNLSTSHMGACTHCCLCQHRWSLYSHFRPWWESGPVIIKCKKQRSNDFVILDLSRLSNTKELLDRFHILITQYT